MHTNAQNLQPAPKKRDNHHRRRCVGDRAEESRSPLCAFYLCCRDRGLVMAHVTAWQSRRTREHDHLHSTYLCIIRLRERRASPRRTYHIIFDMSAKRALAAFRVAKAFSQMCVPGVTFCWEGSSDYLYTRTRVSGPQEHRSAPKRAKVR